MTRSFASSSGSRSFSRRHLVDSVVEGVEATELADEPGGGLLADSGNARDVVGRVALQRLEVDHLVRPQVVALPDLVDVVDHRVLDALPRGHQADARGHDLEHVQVACDDRRVEVERLRLHRQRADHVVGLEARELDRRDAHRLDDPADLRELVAEVVGHALAGRLVFRVLLVAEGRPCRSNATAT